MEAVMQAGAQSGKLVVKADEIYKAFGERKIVDNFSTQIKRGARIGLIGANGAGKTTLLNILLGKLAPDSGNVRLGKNLTPLLLDQQRVGIKQDWNVKDALTDGSGDRVPLGDDSMHVIGYMKNFLFHPAQMRTPVSVLSGGEQARLFLARGLRQPSNLLVMDEPTNDLDLETLDLLQEMIGAYEGTVILVSHDRDFLDRTVTGVFNAEGEGKWLEYAGGYSDMKGQQKAKLKNQDKANEPSPLSKAEGAAPGKAPKAEKPQGKMSYKHKFRLGKLPAEMEALAKLIEKAQALLADAELFTKAPETFDVAVKKLAKAQADLAAAEEEWLELEVLREELDT
jgi:ATP-binding cassette subfamily F protein uup